MLVVLLFGLALPVAARAPAARAPALAPVAGVFLVARRNLPSPMFFRTVVLLTHHDADGTLGVVVNRRTGFDAGELLPDLPAARGAGHAVFIGGPVAPHRIVMLLRRERAAGTVERVTDDISFCADRDVLETLLARRKPASELRLYAGHAGWAPGQLDDELARGDWYLIEAETAAVFEEDSDRLWERLINRLDPPGIRVHTAPAGPAAA
jgi:putative transcriptional regulator